MLDVDPFVRHGRKLPVFAIAVQPASDRISPKYSDFAAGFGITAMMNGHCRMGGNSPYNFFMSFYRMTGRAPFNHEETQDFRLILRHLEQSLSQTLRLSCRPARALGRGGAAGHCGPDHPHHPRLQRLSGYRSPVATAGRRPAAETVVRARPMAWQGHQRPIRNLCARAFHYLPGETTAEDQLSPREPGGHGTAAWQIIPPDCRTAGRVGEHRAQSGRRDLPEAWNFPPRAAAGALADG